MTENKKNQSLEWIMTIGIAVILAIIFRTFFFSSYVVEGESMMPTLQDGNLLMINKISYEFTDFERFDVIVFHANEEDDYVKRIIGVPGDEIFYEDDELYINGEKVEEPYLDSFKEQLAEGQELTGDFTLDDVTGQVKVPENHVFVLGDNRLHSWDSRHIGFVNIDDVVGKVNLRYWPMNEIDMKF
jgi:signal peptidase I